MTNFKNIQAVIFDLDGTLLDSMWVWKDIDIEFLKAHNLDFDEQLQSKIEGMSFTETASYFKEIYQLSQSIDEIKTTWINMTMNKYLHDVTLKEGVMDFLQFLKGNHIKLGIATSNSRQLVSAALERFGLDQLIDYFATACEVDKGKPSPDIYLHVAKELGVEPKNCLVFEDVPAGIMAGKTAGMAVVAIADEFSKHMEDKKRELADDFIETYFEMIGRVSI